MITLRLKQLWNSRHVPKATLRYLAISALIAHKIPPTRAVCNWNPSPPHDKFSDLWPHRVDHKARSSAWSPTHSGTRQGERSSWRFPFPSPKPKAPWGSDYIAPPLSRPKPDQYPITEQITRASRLKSLLWAHVSLEPHARNYFTSGITIIMRLSLINKLFFTNFTEWLH